MLVILSWDKERNGMGLMQKAKLYNYSFRCINISQIIHETLNDKKTTKPPERKRIINNGIELLDKFISGACLVKGLPKKKFVFCLDDLQDYNKAYHATMKMTGGFHVIDFYESLKIILKSDDKKTLKIAQEFFNLLGDKYYQEIIAMNNRDGMF